MIGHQRCVYEIMTLDIHSHASGGVHRTRLEDTFFPIASRSATVLSQHALYVRGGGIMLDISIQKSYYQFV